MTTFVTYMAYSVRQKQLEAYMLGKKQIEQQVVINRSAQDVFAVLDNSSLLPLWAPPVSNVSDCAVNGERVGTERRCQATLSGRSGEMVEKVIDRSDGKSITYAVVKETFGMRKMFLGYGFRLTVSPVSSAVSNVKLETFYTSRNLFVFALNTLFMRRQFRGVVLGLLNGLKGYAEQKPAKGEGTI